MTGSSTSNGSGEYIIAFSTAREARELLANDAMSPLFQAVKEATEEAVYNSLFMATTVTGYQGRTIEALPTPRVLEILRGHNLLSAPAKN